MLRDKNRAKKTIAYELKMLLGIESMIIGVK